MISDFLFARKIDLFLEVRLMYLEVRSYLKVI